VAVSKQRTDPLCRVPTQRQRQSSRVGQDYWIGAWRIEPLRHGVIVTSVCDHASCTGASWHERQLLPNQQAQTRAHLAKTWSHQMLPAGHELRPGRATPGSGRTRSGSSSEDGRVLLPVAPDPSPLNPLLVARQSRAALIPPSRGRACGACARFVRRRHPARSASHAGHAEAVSSPAGCGSLAAFAWGRFIYGCRGS